MKKAFSILALLLAATVPARAYAFAAPVVTQEIRTTNKDIPAPLAQYLTQYNSRYEEQFLSQVLQPLRQTKSKNSIEAADIEKEKEQSQRRTRNFAGEQVMRHDRDFDGKVSLAEIRESLLAVRHDGGFYDENFDAQNAARVKTQADELMKRFDADKDGIITLKEAGEGGNIKPRSRSSARRKSQLAQLLELDPDKDGKLTAAELTAIAKKAFRAADADGDGMLSRKEIEKVQAETRPVTVYGEGCPAPAPAKGDKIVFLGVESGGSLSTAGSAMSGGRDARVVQLDIAKGDGKLYIVTNSRSPVIWRLTGDTARVSRLLLHGGMSDMRIASGVAGLPADKVSYLKYAVDDGGFMPCLPDVGMLRHFSTLGILLKSYRDPEGDYNGALRNILGREADISGLFAAPSRLAIGDKVTVAADGTEQNAPAGYDEATWKDFITMNPGGVVELRKEDIVSEQAFEDVKLQPGLAGVAQLVHTGHLQRAKDPEGATMVVVTGGGGAPLVIRNRDRPAVMQDEAGGRQIRLVDDSIYRVLKPLDDYPRNDGGYVVRYLLGKDMEPPRNKQGCFTVEGEAFKCR